LFSPGSNVAAGTNSFGVAADPSGRFVYVTNYISNDVTLLSVNASTGALTNANSFAAGTNPYKVTVDPSGKFAYVLSNGGGADGILIFAIDANNGNLTAAGSASVGSNPVRHHHSRDAAVAAEQIWPGSSLTFQWEFTSVRLTAGFETMEYMCFQ
jgi:DNA-binding beta-propeller fold protein YncE